MKKLKATSKYKKDYKRFRNQPNKIKKLVEVLTLLQNEIPIPEEYRPHMLTGDYAGFMECHIEGDFLLIWLDPETDQIDLVRLGSHSELFG
ncbi:MAG: type II toxin-antitoxin system YafQ family toxin [Muribaculaceae bacterium]|nr:type II toxin-antitoxin system YafQ family toxin [Muribaculaceae bacterium]